MALSLFNDALSNCTVYTASNGRMTANDLDVVTAYFNMSQHFPGGAKNTITSALRPRIETKYEFGILNAKFVHYEEESKFYVSRRNGEWE